MAAAACCLLLFAETLCQKVKPNISFFLLSLLLLPAAVWAVGSAVRVVAHKLLNSFSGE